MLSKAINQEVKEFGPHRFPEYPPRDDMQNSIHLYKPGYLYAIHSHFDLAESTLVHSEVPLGHTTGQRAGIFIADLMIAFEVDVPTIIGQWGFAIDVQGKSPEFVLEVASPNTSRNDETGKRVGYEAYGVQEYWRFDPTGGQRYVQGLAGDALVDGAYHPVAIETDGERYWGYSEALGLVLCWEEGRLRWYDPVAGRYLPTSSELGEEFAAAMEELAAMREELAAEKEESAAMREELATEREASAAMREKLAAEREASAAEREARNQAEARIRELEAEMERRNRASET